MCDIGQTKYYFYAEDGSKVVFACDGEVKYTYNDEYANEVEKLWENLDLHCK